MKYRYEDMFQRNIGIFTQKEQKRIKNLKVAIAGAGGLGGFVAYMLVRLGVENINICDPEEFDVSNTNRQFGCYVDTIGQNKAVAVANELVRINPNLKIQAWDYGVEKNNVKKFIKDCDVVIDGIDFYALDKSIILQEESRRQNLIVMSSQIAGSVMSTININPKGLHYGDLFILNDRLSIEKVVSILFPILPKEATPDILNKIYAGENIPLTSWAHAPIVTALILVEDFVSYFIKNEKELLFAPTVTVFDVDNKRFEVSGV